MAFICRDVEEYPLGPDQLQEPPLEGCGPRFTVAPEATVADDSSSQVPPLTCRYGVIAVGVQPLVMGIRTAVAE
jgi:hypothetical protein